MKSNIPSGTRLERVSVVTTAADELLLYEAAMQLGVLTYARTTCEGDGDEPELVRVEMLVGPAETEPLLAYVRRQRDAARVTMFTAQPQQVP